MARHGRGGLFRDELLGQVKALCGTVGFCLSKGVLQAVAKVEDPDKIRDMAKLTAAPGLYSLTAVMRAVMAASLGASITCWSCSKPS